MTRSLAFLLVMLMLLLQVPFSAVALDEAEEPSLAQNVSTPPPSDEVVLESEGELFEFETVSTVREVTDLREESVKHFTRPDGTYEAVTYADAVHRKDADGKWQDIDNNLALQNVRGVQQFTTSDLRTTFAKSFAPNSALFTLDENGYTVSMSYLSVGLSESSSKAAATAKVTNAPLRTQTEWETVEEAAVVNNTSSIVYADIKENTDLEYVLQGNDIKENIIVKAPAGSYAYQFELTLAGLVAKMQNDGSIDLCDATTGDVKYNIPAPYMVDANGERSNAVAYTLTSTSKGVYKLTVTANAAWINAKERAFPVKIDPSINYDTGIIDTHISSQQPNTSFGSYEDLVIHPQYGSYAYIKTNLPTLPAGADVISAHLRTDYYYDGVEGSWIMLGAYQVTSAWSESLTWNQYLAGQGAFNVSGYCWYEYAHYFSGMSDYWNDTIEWDITDPLEDWYEDPTTNFGIAFQYEYDDAYTVYIKSSEAAFGCPYMTVQYAARLADGVYVIYSTAYQNRWMTVAGGSTEAGANVQHTTGSTNPVTDLEHSRHSLFKISYRESTDSYIIRSMLNNNLGLGYSDDLSKVITKTIPSVDADVPANDTFKIEWQADGNGFKLYPNGISSYVISITSTSTENLAPVPKVSSGAPSVWLFAKYTGTHVSDFTFTYPNEWVNKGFVVGTTLTTRIVGWSTVIDANVPVIATHDSDADLIDCTWDETNQELTITAKNPGRFILYYRIMYSTTTSSVAATYRTIHIVPQDGTFLLQNAGSIKYMDIENSSFDSGAAIQQWEYLRSTQEQWQVEHVANSGGYVRFKSVYSNLYLGVDPQNTTLVKQYSAANDYTLWLIDRTERGNLQIMCKYTFGGTYALSVPSSSQSNGTNLVQAVYTNDANCYDEWRLILPMSGYELDYEPELWNYFPVQNYTNCYAYALNNQVYPQNESVLWRMQPGRYIYIANGSTYDPLNNDADNVRECVELDSEALGFVFEAIDKYDVCSEGAYKVALVIESKPTVFETDYQCDYHWYRQDSDGFWSHKQGNQEVTRLDKSECLITDPETANRGIYTIFIGFFEVTPLNQMADPSFAYENWIE